MKHLLSCGIAFVAACGGSPTPADPSEHMAELSESAGTHAGRKGGGPSVQSELGEIDQKEAERAFANAEAAIAGCHKKGVARIEYLSGDVAFLVRVSAEGKARYVVLESSTLGDRATEKCMTDALAKASWPTPVGGEAEARKSIGFTPGDAREPVTWSPEKVAAVLQDKSDALTACKQGSSAQFHVTAYVEPSGKDGKIQSLGVASSSPEAFASADCVVNALKSAKLPSPGSYAAKVSFDF